MNRFLHKFNRDERGTSLTEFIITVPIFITLFIGLMQIGLSNERSIRVWSLAYQDTFTQAYQVQRSAADPRMQATVGAGMALADINQMSTTRVEPIQRLLVLASDGYTYGQLAINGTMGESYARNAASDAIFDQYAASDGVLLMEGIQTDDIVDMTGESEYAKTLLDDGPSQPNFSGSGAGPLSVVQALITASGIRPAIATGVRYGTVTGQDSSSDTFMGLSYSYNAYFTTLVAPASTINIYGGENGAEGMATGITRLGLEDFDPYTDLLGVQWLGKTLSSDSMTVPCPSSPHFLDCP